MIESWGSRDIRNFEKLRAECCGGNMKLIARNKCKFYCTQTELVHKL